MKIKLKLTPDTVLALDDLLCKAYDTSPAGKSTEQKTLLSFAYELSDVFQKMAKKIIRSTDLFNVKKRISLSLKYHEAWALERIVRELIYLEENDYKKMLLQKIADEINQKLL